MNKEHELRVWRTYVGNLLELLTQWVVSIAADTLDELVHDPYLKSTLNYAEGIGMLRIRSMPQTIDSKGVVALQAGKRMPVVVVTKAEAGPHGLVVGDAMD